MKRFHDNIGIDRPRVSQLGATHLRLFRNTVHSQIAGIVRKTSVCRHGERNVLMLRGPAAVMALGESSYPGWLLNRKQ